jgi:hypothetical protein
LQLDEAFAEISDIREAVIGPTIEWWDVVGESGKLHSRAWFYGVDSSVLR